MKTRKITKTIIRLPIAALLCLYAGCLVSQSSFYSTDNIQEIRIVVPAKNWRHILDSLMKAGDTNQRIDCDVYINGEHFAGAGVRFKGLSSWNYGAVKNPFNIRLDYKISNRNYQGYKKLRLANVIHDPSFLREALSYHVARQYMVAPEAGFANVWVNDTLIGLYTNVESVDDLFVEKHFGGRRNTLIKGSPQKLVFPFGDNSNLAFISNTDSMAYAPYYDVVSDFGWQKLMEMIDYLNHRPDTLEYLLNIDRALWMHAFNYSLLNFDSYIGYAQNYYLAADHHGRLNTIPWDMNMSFGSFRATDGSYMFQGMTIPQIIASDPLQHLIFSISPRPLMTRLFENSTYRRMFIAHLRTIVEEQFESGELMDYAAYLQNKIAGAVLQDTNRFYTFSGFLDNIDTTVHGNTPGMFYVGIGGMIEGRTRYLRSYPGFNAHPVIGTHTLTPASPGNGQLLHLQACISDADEVWLCYRFSSAGRFTKVMMHDDGLHYDSLPGDGIWGVMLQCDGDILQYYFYAQNDSAGVFEPARAETSFYTIYPQIAKGKLVVNEINRAPVMLHHGEVESTGHWIELFNNSFDTLSAQGMWISTEKDNLYQWEFPDTLIPPRSFFILYADGSGSMPNRCNFTLYKPQGWIRIGYAHEKIIDEVYYPLLEGNSTFGRYPNGTGDFFLMHASLSQRNSLPVVRKPYVRVYPNPVKGIIFLEGITSHDYICSIFSTDGRLIRRITSEKGSEEEQYISIKLNLAGIPAGTYILQVVNGGMVNTKKIILYE